jgi:hypothetical protein
VQDLKSTIHICIDEDPLYSELRDPYAVNHPTVDQIQRYVKATLPTKRDFVDLVRHFAVGRAGRPDCSIEIALAGACVGDSYDLVKLVYNADNSGHIGYGQRPEVSSDKPAPRDLRERIEYTLHDSDIAKLAKYLASV